MLVKTTIRISQKTRLSNDIAKLIFFFVAIFFIIHSQFSIAAGKHPAPIQIPACTLPNGTKITTPTPAREASILPVGTKIFNLPNGTKADLSMDLNSILNTAITESHLILPQAPHPINQVGLSNPCDTHIEIRSTITTFQLDILDLGITVGFTPSNIINIPITNAKGKANTQIGNISMDFSIWKCTAGSCTSIAASTASHLTTGINLNFEIDLNLVKTGSDLVYTTPLAKLLRTIMTQGIQTLIESPNINSLPWSARVISYSPNTGILAFDAGSQSGLSVYQAFEIDTKIESQSNNGCPVYQLIGFAHTTAVGDVSSYAIIDEIIGSHEIQLGDAVMIRKVGN